MGACVLLIALAATSIVTAQTTRPASAPTSMPTTAQSVLGADDIARFAGAKVTAAMEALAAGDNARAIQESSAGLELYGNAITSRIVEPTRINLYHILSIAQLRSGAIRPAQQSMSRIRDTQKNKTITLNDALLDAVVRTKLARAADTLDTYFSTNPPDEYAVDLFGYVLSELEDPPTSRVRVSDRWDVYRRVESLLSPPSPGLVRWGSEWITDEQMASNEKQKEAAETRRAELQRWVDHWQRYIESTKAQVSWCEGQCAADRKRYGKETDSSRESLNDAKKYLKLFEEKTKQARRDLEKAPKAPGPTFAAPARSGLMPELVQAMER